MNLRTIVIASVLSIRIDSIVAFARPAVKGPARANASVVTIAGLPRHPAAGRRAKPKLRAAVAVGCLDFAHVHIDTGLEGLRSRPDF